MTGFNKIRHIFSGWTRAHWLIALVGIGLCTAIYWAGNSGLGQTVRAPGQVIARARTQTIQAADDGVISAILVSEGDRVRKGQILARFDKAQANAGYRATLGTVAALEAVLARTRAEMFGTALAFPQEVQEYPDLVATQTQLFKVRRRALDQEVSALDHSLALVREQIRISQPLVTSGDMGSLELVALRQREAELSGAIVTRRDRYLQESQGDMTKAAEELLTQHEVLAGRTSLLDRTEVRAPVDGLVRKIYFSTTGARLRPGDVLMDLVPTGGDLIFEAKLPPVDIASIRNGLKAHIKFDAYDFSIYGSLVSQVEYVSPDALVDRTARGDVSYYVVQLAIDPKKLKAWNALRRGTQAIDLQPGMSGTAEVHTGDRTVLSYLTKPIIKTWSESLGEK